MKTPNIQIVLGFDFGRKRIGVAVGQMITKTARPLDTLKATAGIPVWEQVTALINAWQPDAIIVGIPLNMDGTSQIITKEAEQFEQELKKRYDIPVYGTDERLTTREAREQLFSKGGYKAIKNSQVDSVAAQLILQTWMAENSK